MNGCLNNFTKDPNCDSIQEMKATLAHSAHDQTLVQRTNDASVLSSELKKVEEPTGSAMPPVFLPAKKAPPKRGYTLFAETGVGGMRVLPFRLTRCILAHAGHRSETYTLSSGTSSANQTCTFWVRAR
jgi:hypothetical protein